VTRLTAPASATNDELLARFVAAIRVGSRAPADQLEHDARTAGRALLARWAESHRRYHDRRHLAEVLERLDDLTLPAKTQVAAVIELAAFFHDAVYEPLAGDNEERSAQLAEVELAQLGWAPAAVREVGRLVRLTRDHTPEDSDPAGALLCDADLGILAAEPAAYAAYTAAVRAEYAMVPEPQFRAGRARILAALVARPIIFATPGGRARWEEPARRNLTAELSSLGAPDDLGAAPTPAGG
jgi:predicted metal-dependent HD superfamily phosphohydrolase